MKSWIFRTAAGVMFLVTTSQKLAAQTLGNTPDLFATDGTKRVDAAAITQGQWELTIRKFFKSRGEKVPEIEFTGDDATKVVGITYDEKTGKVALIEVNENQMKKFLDVRKAIVAHEWGHKEIKDAPTFKQEEYAADSVAYFALKAEKGKSGKSAKNALEKLFEEIKKSQKEEIKIEIGSIASKHQFMKMKGSKVILDLADYSSVKSALEQEERRPLPTAINKVLLTYAEKTGEAAEVKIPLNELIDASYQTFHKLCEDRDDTHPSPDHRSRAIQRIHARETSSERGRN